MDLEHMEVKNDAGEESLAKKESPQSLSNPSLTHRFWEKLRLHQEPLDALSSLLNIIISLLVGGIGIYVAVQVRDITKYQADIARLSQTPIISLRVARKEESGKLQSE